VAILKKIKYLLVLEKLQREKNYYCLTLVRSNPDPGQIIPSILLFPPHDKIIDQNKGI